jgi:hypothetical protein
MSNAIGIITIETEQLSNVTGAGDFWNAVGGALRIVSSPIRAVGNGAAGTIGALSQGHRVGDSLANGLVQAAGGMGAPNLANIPANPGRR